METLRGVTGPGVAALGVTDSGTRAGAPVARDRSAKHINVNRQRAGEPDDSVTLPMKQSFQAKRSIKFRHMDRDMPA
jgi:hypothetical protein